mmetsp:Transcript_12199/g.38677  ORF Transcript_12199/g.38677 Transcript_12199/m.38677 type:complete len:184 (-) Transcript_12199:129-680(-)
MLIRRAHPEDCVNLAAIGRQTFSETFGHLYAAQDLAFFLDHNHTAQAYAELIARDDCIVLVVLVDSGRMVGYGVATRRCTLPRLDGETDAAFGAAAEIKRMYIVSSAQGKGYGTRLLEELLAWHGDAPDIRLAVWSQNTGAHRLYGRYGFAFARSFAFAVGEHEDHEFVFRRYRPPTVDRSPE